MADYELLEHTADTGFRVRGSTLEELFVRAAEALVAIAVDASRAEARERRRVECSGATVDELVVNWLNEVLWLLDGERFVPVRFEELTLAGDAAEAAVWGEARDDERHPPRIVVKAATYHQLVVCRHNDGWEAEVFLDI
ncbi:MAG: archease [Bryobacteraceae bacterium]